MRIARIKGSPEGAGYYHVMSRTTGRQMLFGAREKNVFVKQLRRHAEFAGVEVMTWCMMDNHFHLLIRIPVKGEHVAGLLSNGRKLFWKRLRVLYSRERVKAVKREVEQLERDPGGRGRAEELVERYTRRMADLSAFVQALKHAFTVWFNHKHGREGTLWMDRFKSVLLEGDSSVLRKVAAYIDLNPIRAGLVKDPGNYRWSGYGQSAGGVVEARRGLSTVYGYRRNEWRKISGKYRALLYLEGVEVRNAGGKVVRVGVSDEDFYRETTGRGGESPVRRLSKRVRYLTDGAAVGSREFLERVFEENRTKFGPKRKTGARKFRGKEWKGSGMFALRDLG